MPTPIDAIIPFEENQKKYISKKSIAYTRVFIIPAGSACFQFFLRVSKKSLKPKECLSLAILRVTFVSPALARPFVKTGTEIRS